MCLRTYEIELHVKLGKKKKEVLICNYKLEILEENLHVLVDEILVYSFNFREYESNSPFGTKV